MRALAVIFSAFLVAFFPLNVSAAPQSNCSYGCNIVDDGLLNGNLIGQTLVYRGNGQVIDVTVLSVNTYNQQILWQTSSGQSGWGNAREYYTPYRSRQQSDGYAAGTAAGIAIIACFFFCPRGNSSQGSSSSYSQDRREAEACWERCQPLQDLNPAVDQRIREDCLRRCRR